MSKSIFHNFFFRTGLTVLALLLTSNPVATAQELLDVPNIYFGQINSAGFVDDSYFEHSGDEFAIEIGDKSLDDETIVKFQAKFVKEGNFFSDLAELFGYQNRGGVSFQLINSYDSYYGATDFQSNTKTSNILSHFLSKFNNAKKSTLQDNTLVINDAIQDLDIKYSALANGLKEEIVIDGDDEVADSYQYLVSLNAGVQLQQATSGNVYNLPTGTIYLTDSDDNYFAHFEPFIAYDSNGAKTTNIATSIEKTDNTTYILTASIDRDWLLSDNRQYPVILDPTIVHDTETEFDNGVSLNHTEVTTDPYVQTSPYGNDDNTQLLLHMEGANGGTSFIDSSPSAHSVTSNNGASTNAFPRFGDTAGYFDDYNNYLSIPDSDDFYFDDDFTIDFWMYFNSLPSNDWDMIATQYQGSNDRMGLYFDTRTTQSNPGMRFDWASGGSWVGLNYTANEGSNWKTGKWYHVAVVRNGNEWNLYRDGVSVASYSGALTYPNYSGQFTVGGEPHEGKYLDGYIDEFRISNGIARWTDNFTPPAKPYSNSQEYGTYTSEVLDLGTTAPTFNSFEWIEHGVRTGDGETDLTDNALVAHWKFNESSGTTVSDSSGNGHNGTATNMTTTGQDDSVASGWTANNRKWGSGAIMFDGSNDYVDLGKTTTVKNQSKVTIASWIKINSFGSYNTIFYESNDTSAYTRLNLTVETDGKLRMGGRDSDGTPSFKEFAISHPGAIKAGQWYFVTGVYDADTDNHKVYLNGKDITASTTASVTFPNTDPTDNVRLGATHSTYGNMIMDSTRLYFRALDVDEINSLYQAGNVQLQTRTGADSTPDDGDWEEWKPAGTGTETQINDFDNSYLYDATDSDLVGYWPMNETSGTTVDDPAGSNDGTASGTTIVDGKFAKTRSFDASNNDNITIADSTSLDITDEISIEAWVYPTAYSSYDRIVNKAWATDADPWGIYRIALSDENDGLESSEFCVTIGGADTCVYASDSVPLKEWTHIAGTYNGSTLTIYINGIEISSTGLSGSLNTNDQPVIIGKYNHHNSFNFNGQIDEVKIYDAGLSADSVYNNYLAGIDRLGISPCLIQDSDSNINIEGTNAQKITTGAPKVDANTVGLWHLDETGGSGAYIKDSSNNSNNGTPTGTSIIKGFANKGRGLDGSSDYIQISDDSSLDFGTGDFTIDGWVKPTSNTGYRTIAAKFAASGSWGDGWFLEDNTSGLRFVTRPNTSDSSGTSTNYTSGLATNKWSHVAGVRSGSTLYLYVDGILVSQSTGTADNIDTSADLYLGLDVVNSRYFQGGMDGFRISNTARTADEIYEAYRSGRDHYINYNLDSSVDLSSNTLLPFYVASDQPGTHAEVTFGESAFANNLPDANTVGLWHFDRTGGLSILDSSSYSHDGTENLSSDKIYTAQFGQSRYFNGSSDWVNLDTHAGDMPSGSDNVTVSAWVRWNSVPSSNQVIASYGGNDSATGWILHYEATRKLEFNMRGNSVKVSSGITPITGKWYYIVGTYDHSSAKLYIDGKLAAESNLSGNIVSASTLRFGNEYNRSYYFNGYMDELRIDDTARTAEEIRQAYEYEKRTHQVTIDFAASLDSGNLITGSTDTSFTIDATTKGLPSNGSYIYVGDKIIIRENYDGTEYIAQGTVDSVNISTGAISISAWDASSTFPTSGFTVDADVFKWQREYFDASDALDSHINSVNNITWRVLDGDRGRTFWIDDLNMVNDYLTDPTGSSIASTPNQYFQYRILETSTNNNLTSKVSSVTLDYSYPVTMTGGSTSSSYLYNTNKTAFNVQCNGVTIAQTGKTVYCEGSWDQTNWYTVGSASSPLSDATIQGTPNVASWVNYPSDGNVNLYVRATVDGNPTSTYSFSVEKDTVNPEVTAIASVAGDPNSPYYDTTDDSSTTVVYTASPDASTCKWSETDITYTAMTNTCTDTSSCELNLSGLGNATVYMACEDTAGNYTSQTNNYQLDYTIGGVSMTGATSSDSAINNHNKTAYNIQCNGVTAPASGTVTCYASFDQSDWHEVDNTTTPVSSITLENDLNVTGWTGYTPDGDKTIYVYATDSTNDSEEYSFASHVDTVYPVINSITSVAGDTVAPYEDVTNNGSTFVVFDASADSDQCKWSVTDQSYDDMGNSCGSAGNSCNLTLTGVQAHTAYIRCIDSHGNKQQSSLQVDYEIVSEAPISVGWKYYRYITLDVGTPLDNYQQKIELNPGNFDYANSQDDGGDIRFFDELGEAEFSYWIETWNTAGTSEVWVSVPNAGTTHFLMQYGNNNATSTSSYDDVFIKDYSHESGLVAQYLLDNPEDSTVYDSSGNGLDGIRLGGVYYGDGDGAQWDGRSDIKFSEGSFARLPGGSDIKTNHIRIDDSDELDLTQAITVEAWILSHTVGSYDIPVHKSHTSCDSPWAMYGLKLDTQKHIFLEIGNVGSVSSTTQLSINTWYHVVGTYDNATDEAKIYINGHLDNENIFSGDFPMPSNDMPLAIGNSGRNPSTGQSGCNEPWRGHIDSVRIYDHPIGADEILAHYEHRLYSTVTPVASVGGVHTDTEELSDQADWYDTHWAYRTELTVINEGNANALTDYQVQANIDTKIYIDQSQMQTDGDDIRFTDEDGVTLMPYYIISGINTNNTRVYLRIPSVPANNNKTIYMYYGNPSASAYENFDDTFTKNSGFDNLVGSWHFDEGADNTCDGGKDACDDSGYDNHGTFSDGPTWQGNELAQWDNRSDLKFSTGDSLYFDGIDDYIGFDYDASMYQPTNHLTISAWIETDTSNVFQPIVAQRTGSYPNWEFAINSSNQLYFYFKSYGTYSYYTAYTTTADIQPGSLTHVVLVYDGIYTNFYQDGQLLSRQYMGGTLDRDSSRPTFIGYRNLSDYFSGYMDEVKMYKSALSSDEILGLYEHRKATSPEPQVGYERATYQEVGGEITGPNEWNGQSTIYVSDPVIVNSGSTLTIEPGTIIKFDPNTYIEINGGTIVAEGTSGNPIYFTSRDDNFIGLTVNDSDGAPNNGDWNGIYVHGDNAAGSFKFCNFNYGGEELLLDGTTFKGILNTKQVNITATNNVFNNSANADLFVYQASPIVERNNLGDSSYGLYIEADNSVVASTVQYNSFANTTNSAIYVDGLPDTDNDGGPGLILRYNDIDSTNTGYYIQNLSGTSVRDNNAENTVDAYKNAFENISGYMCYYEVSGEDCKFERTSGGEILYDTNSNIITSPNGNGSYFATSSQNITWDFNNGSGAGDYIDIYLSTNSGLEFDQTIASQLLCDGSGTGSGCTGSTGSYSWTVPSLSTTEGRIKISMKNASGETLVEDISDHDFSITVIEDTMSNVATDADSSHIIKFVVGQDCGTYIDDSVKVTFPTEFDLSITASDVSATGGDVIWSESEIIDINTVTFPFIGTLDSNDEVINLNIGLGQNLINNPSDEGSYRITVGVHEGQAGNAYPLERMSTNVLISDGIGFNINVESALEFSIRDITDSQDITELDFGEIETNVAYNQSHLLKVSTNAYHGYTVTAHEITEFTDGSDNVPDINGTNAYPTVWSSPTGTGFYGYHTSDSTLGTGTTTRFTNSDTWAAMTSDPAEVAYSNSLVQNDTTTMTYRLQVTSGQSSGDYSHTVLYICTAKY